MARLNRRSVGRISGEAVEISDELEPGLRILADVALRVVQERQARRPRLVQAEQAEEPLDGLRGALVV